MKVPRHLLTDPDRRDVAAWSAWRRENPGASIDLVGANLYGANLRGANLCDADLSGADLSGANLSNANLSGAKWDETTVWPAGFTPPTADQNDTTPVIVQVATVRAEMSRADIDRAVELVAELAAGGTSAAVLAAFDIVAVLRDAKRVMFGMNESGVS